MLSNDMAPTTLSLFSMNLSAPQVSWARERQEEHKVRPTMLVEKVSTLISPNRGGERSHRRGMGKRGY